VDWTGESPGLFGTSDPNGPVLGAAEIEAFGYCRSTCSESDVEEVEVIVVSWQINGSPVTYRGFAFPHLELQ